MTLPIIGPVIKTTYSGLSVTQRTVYKQTKPYDLDLPYTCYRWETSDPFVSATGYDGSHNGPINRLNTGDIRYATYQGTENAAIQMAVKRFNSEKGTAASMLVALATIKQTADMVSNRLYTLVKVFKAIKSLNGKDLLTALDLSYDGLVQKEKSWLRAGRRGVRKLPSTEAAWHLSLNARRRRLNAKSIAGNYLEYAYGWAPTVGDVISGLQVLENPSHLHQAIEGSSKSLLDYTVRSVITGTAWIDTRVCTHVCTIRARVAAEATTDSRQLNRLSALGLTDLASVIYEVTPWSFVFNYFINLEEYIAQYKPELGISLSNPYYTVSWDDTTYVQDIRQNKSTKAIVSTKSHTRRAFSMQRYIGSLPTIKLGMRSRYGNSLSRALNNVSLLTQFLGKGK